MTTFDGVTIPRDALRGPTPGLLQEHLEAFRAFHSKDEHARDTGEDDEKIAVHLARRHQEASDIYRALSAHWASAGRTRDAGWAYYHGRRLEIAALRPDRVRHRRSCGGAGGRLHPGITWGGPGLGALAHGQHRPVGRGIRREPVPRRGVDADRRPGLRRGIRRVGSGSEREHRVVERVRRLGALQPQAMTASLDLGEDPARWVEWASEIETALGITLLGLLGFCLGNRLRSA
ncbi:hypothetical protein [Aeromicrobium sp. UC242_57]|uniref:hypothetical protein n=1 Tax=Aeromicrobium sp. UC242_57 TaxID=3374624 RepID=UPI00379386B6